MAVTIFAAIDVGSVSYTHLDVYKRQLRTGFEPVLHERKSCVLTARPTEHERGCTSISSLLQFFRHICKLSCHNKYYMPGNYCNKTIYSIATVMQSNSSRGI